MEAAFKHFFGMEPIASLNTLNNLTPGDFAVVAKKAKICDIKAPEKIIAMLQQEQDVKEMRAPVGFAVM